VGKLLDQFLKVLGNFMRTIILQKYFEFDVIRFTGYGVIAEKAPRLSFRPNFSMHPVGKIVLWIKN